MDQASREEWINSKIDEIGREAFPDNLEETWMVRAIQHDSDVSYVEAEATSGTVGYSRLKFVMDFTDPASPTNTAAMSREGDEWSMLYQSRDRTSGTEGPEAPTGGCGRIVGLFNLFLGVIGIIFAITLNRFSLKQREPTAPSSNC
ncbi:MAG: hypothetical protein CMJ62_18360 [Planctomycetaceae bacterium]|nr:hypothetical protein [Planctomycetaceae bacterium]